LSGLGAKEELEKFGIKVVKDLPAVGKNMYDVGVFLVSYTATADVAWRWQHLTGGTLTFRTKKGYSLMFLYNALRSLPYSIYWLFTGKGPLSSNVCCLSEIDLLLPLLMPLTYSSGK
jgi:choline dehydrogenase